MSAVQCSGTGKKAVNECGAGLCVACGRLVFVDIDGNARRHPSPTGEETNDPKPSLSAPWADDPQFRGRPGSAAP